MKKHRLSMQTVLASSRVTDHVVSSGVNFVLEVPDIQIGFKAYSRSGN